MFEVNSNDAKTMTFAPCPKCYLTKASEVWFSWWGGVVGPKMFTHVKCQNCKTKYNGKTGKYNTINITLYVLITGLAFIVVFGIYSFIVFR